MDNLKKKEELWKQLLETIDEESDDSKWKWF